MARAIQHLVEELREVVHPHYYEGQKIDEIARMTKTSPATVAKRLSRAREVLDLKVWELDVGNGVPSINDAKGGKNRAVPMSESLSATFAEHWETMGLTRPIPTCATPLPATRSTGSWPKAATPTRCCRCSPPTWATPTFPTPSTTST